MDPLENHKPQNPDEDSRTLAERIQDLERLVKGHLAPEVEEASRQLNLAMGLLTRIEHQFDEEHVNRERREHAAGAVTLKSVADRLDEVLRRIG